MASLFDTTLESLLNEMMITTTQQKKDGEGMQPTTQNTNPVANQPSSEQKVPETNTATVNPNASTAANAVNTSGASTSTHWADNLLNQLKTNGSTIDLKGIPELAGLSPEQKALLAHHLLAK